MSRATIALVIVAFAVLFVGLTQAVRTLLSVPGDRVTAESVTTA
jgi:hypothetical protein